MAQVALPVMAILSVAQGGASLIGANEQSNALKAQGEYSRRQYEQNAQFAEIQASDAINRGEKAAARRGLQTKYDIGTSRSRSAAQGVDVNRGSAAGKQGEIAGVGAIDEQTLKNNAWREAWGYKVQATDYRSQGIMAQSAANNAAGNTLLTGGLNFAKGITEAGYYATKK